MGGWMDYARVRNRNGLLPRKPLADPDPYPRDLVERPGSLLLLVGDLNRMERDYLRPQYPEHPWATRPPGSDPASECAAATGVPVETVQAVLRHVFWGGHNEFDPDAEA